MDITTLKDCLYYNPLTGEFIWKKKIANKIKIGGIAGRINQAGYVQIQLFGERKYAHVLAWFYMSNEWPDKNIDIDHINRIRSDNRWCNLRKATRLQNNVNTSLNSKNKLGLKGVHLHKKSGKYIAQIRINGDVVVLARCYTPEEAKSIYDAKSKELHKEFYHKPD